MKEDKMLCGGVEVALGVSRYGLCSGRKSVGAVNG